MAPTISQSYGGQTDSPSYSSEGGNWFSNLPTWTWYVVGVVAVILLFLFAKSRGGATQTGSVVQGSPTGSGATGASDPNLTGALSQIQANEQKIWDLMQQSSSTNGGPAGPPNAGPGTVPIPTPGVPPDPAPRPTNDYQARAQGSIDNAGVRAWDMGQGGVPIRSGPGGSEGIIGWIPWNMGGLHQTGEVTGASSNVGGPQTYYNINYGGVTGFVSTQDIAVQKHV